MKTYFDHEKLDAYKKAIAFAVFNAAIQRRSTQEGNEKT
jgi:hypothetical protein